MTSASNRVVEVFRTFGGDALRDVWVFDQRTHENLYVRDDVEAALADLDVETFVDNERYGYMTRDTYEALYYADYRYTVRGFSSFEQFRTFVERGRPVGLLASFDCGADGFEYAELDERVRDALAEYPADALGPRRSSPADD